VLLGGQIQTAAAPCRSLAPRPTVLQRRENRTALIIGVGGFLGMGEKDVSVPFSSVRAGEKNNKWYLVLNTNKEALKAAPGFTYDKTKTTWMPAAK
jgi:hypothetical protein